MNDSDEASSGVDYCVDDDSDDFGDSMFDDEAMGDEETGMNTPLSSEVATKSETTIGLSSMKAKTKGHSITSDSGAETQELGKLPYMPPSSILKVHLQQQVSVPETGQGQFGAPGAVASGEQLLAATALVASAVNGSHHYFYQQPSSTSATAAFMAAMVPHYAAAIAVQQQVHQAMAAAFTSYHQLQLQHLKASGTKRELIAPQLAIANEPSRKTAKREAPGIDKSGRIKINDSR